MGYFKPWRRKVGVVTLILACVFAAGWARSYSTVDYFTLNSSMSLIFVSGSGSFCLTTGRSGRHINTPGEPVVMYISPVSYLWRPVGSGARKLEFVWYNYRAPKVEIYRSSGPGTEKRIEMIPFWCVLLPIALLSAWLLLSKPRQRKPSIEQQAAA
jgi:hypothetical protein